MCVCHASKLGFVRARRGRRSPFDAGGNVQGRDEKKSVLKCACQWALTVRRTLGGGGALERGHGALLERLAQLGDALSGVLAVTNTITVEATELVHRQAAQGGEGQCQWALTEKQTLRVGARRT